MKPTNKAIIQELDALKSALANLANGGSLANIREMSGMQIGVRTMQRRLARLAEMGELRVTGGKRSARYFPVSDGEELVVAEDGTRQFVQKNGTQIKLSVASRQILETVRFPEKHRSSVSYDRTFLESYRPNIDSYLTAPEKKKLAEIGKTSKSDHPAGTYAREILNKLLIDLSWNSSRLKGNTYTLSDTERLIESEETAEQKSELEAQMILNHKEAIEFLVQSPGNIGFNRFTILNLHALLSDNLLPDPADAGRVRRNGAGIPQSRFIPLANPELIEEMFSMILEKACKIEDPFEQSFFIMVHIPYLQPFDDVNNRVARLAANISLNSHNLSPLTFADLPEDLYSQCMQAIYEQKRIEPLRELFLRTYERSSSRYSSVRQLTGEPDPFKLKYRNTIRTLIAEIIAKALGHKAASKLIDERSQTLPDADHTQFITVVASELLSLHEGNFARYFVSPAEFARWKREWER